MNMQSDMSTSAQRNASPPPEDVIAQAEIAANNAIAEAMQNIQNMDTEGQIAVMSPSASEIKANSESPGDTPMNHTGTNVNPGNYSTQELLMRARREAAAKSNTATKTGSQTTRQAWTQEEENALMAGLDQVQGTKWSEILALYGPGGSINEVLKDRSQIQLKDKARNLKLFFLKHGSEVPHYLSKVTGELKTRAPNQAAKAEAIEKERRKQELASARYSGLQALDSMSRQRDAEMNKAATSESQPPQAMQTFASAQETPLQAQETEGHSTVIRTAHPSTAQDQQQAEMLLQQPTVHDQLAVEDRLKMGLAEHAAQEVQQPGGTNQLQNNPTTPHSRPPKSPVSAPPSQSSSTASVLVS
jgi:hypothetical protein